MKIKTFSSQAFMIIITSVITSCAPATTLLTQPSETVSPIVNPSPSLTPRPQPAVEFPPSPTPIPNMQPDKIPLLIAALQDGTCQLPCYLGIIPGETTLQKGIAILENLGGNEFISGYGPNPYQRETDGALLYTFEFNVDSTPPRDMVLSHSVTLITDNDIIQIIEVGAGTIVAESPQSLETYRAFFQRYSAREIFLQTGKPDTVSVGLIEHPNQLGDDLVILYTKQNIAIDLYGTGLENNLCPNNEAKHIYLHMLLSHPNSTLDIYSDGQVPFTNQEIYPRIEEVFNIGADEFYEQVLSDPTVCFEQLLKP